MSWCCCSVADACPGPLAGLPRPCGRRTGRHRRRGRALRAADRGGLRCGSGRGADPAAACRPARRRGGPRGRMVDGPTGAPRHRAAGAVDSRRNRPRHRRRRPNGAVRTAHRCAARRSSTTHSCSTARSQACGSSRRTPCPDCARALFAQAGGAGRSAGRLSSAQRVRRWCATEPKRQESFADLRFIATRRAGCW